MTFEEIERLFSDRVNVRQTMPRVDGKRYICPCGANVFSAVGNYFKCNGCGDIFESEKTKDNPMPEIKVIGY